MAEGQILKNDSANGTEKRHIRYIRFEECKSI